MINSRGIILSKERFFILLIAGVPGTGKSTVSRELSIELECRHESSSELLTSLGLAVSDPTGRQTLLVDRVGVEKGYKYLKEAWREKCVILETVYPSLWIEIAEEDIPMILLLRTHPRTLLERLTMKKNWPRSKIIENVIAEAIGTVASELIPWEHMVFEVDTTSRSSSETIRELFNLIDKWRTGIRIDWLSDPLVGDLLVKLESTMNSD